MANQSENKSHISHYVTA